MSDQVETVDAEADLLAALGDSTPEMGSDPEQEGEDAPEVTEEGDESEQKQDPEKFVVKVKNDAGQDEDREVSLDELAKGYMLQADYTRKTQELARQRQDYELQSTKALQEQQSQVVERIAQLQELVLSQAAPELNGVDWVSLAAQDPARFVQLQAKQQQVQGLWQALEQQKAHSQQESERQTQALVNQALVASDEVLKQAIPGLDGAKTAELLQSVEKSVGWTIRDIQTAALAMTKAGMHPQTLGKVLVLAHKAIQFDKLQAEKPAALRKVAEAPRVIKPAAPQPRNTQRADTERLRKSGRVEDLARLL